MSVRRGVVFVLLCCISSLSAAFGSAARPRRLHPTPSPLPSSFTSRIFGVVPGFPSQNKNCTVHRAIGGADLSSLGAFLQLDDVEVGERGRLDEVPSREVNTLTYVVKGGVLHEDNGGNEVLLRATDYAVTRSGDGYWQSNRAFGYMQGRWIQVWIAADHPELMMETSTALHRAVSYFYESDPSRPFPLKEGSADVDVSSVMRLRIPYVSERVLFGRGVMDSGKNGIEYLKEMSDVQLGNGGSWYNEVGSDHRGFVYVLEGECEVQGFLTKRVRKNMVAILDSGSLLVSQSKIATECR